MNILYVAPDIPVPHTGEFVGGSTHVLKIAEGLEKKGNKVIIVSRRVSKDQSKFEEISENIFTRRIFRGLIFPISGKISSKSEKKVKIIPNIVEKMYFISYRLILIIFMLYLIKRHNIDVILDRSSSKGIGVFSGFLFRTPTFVELLDPDYSNLSLKLTNKIFAYTKKIVNLNLHDKVEIVTAGVDINNFRGISGKKIKKEFGLEEKKVVVYIGAMSAWHGPEDLIDVATKLKEDVKFLMVGKDLDMLEEVAKKRGVNDKFIFTGFVEHEKVAEYISVGDVAAAPYNPKGFKDMEKYGFYFSPIKIFEYMACQKPIVTNDLEIIRDIINENKCGLLAKPGDKNDFAEKIGKLLDDDNLRQQLGINGKNAVMNRYSWDKIAENIYNFMIKVKKTD